MTIVVSEIDRKLVVCLVVSILQDFATLVMALAFFNLRM
jgi:hypothetical protein